MHQERHPGRVAPDRLQVGDEDRRAPCRTSDGSSSCRRPWTNNGSSISRLEQQRSITATTSSAFSSSTAIISVTFSMPRKPPIEDLGQPMPRLFEGGDDVFSIQLVENVTRRSFAMPPIIGGRGTRSDVDA